jgi:hypothetical protein
VRPFDTRVSPVDDFRTSLLEGVCGLLHELSKPMAHQGLGQLVVGRNYPSRTDRLLVFSRYFTRIAKEHAPELVRAITPDSVWKRGERARSGFWRLIFSPSSLRCGAAIWPNLVCYGVLASHAVGQPSFRAGPVRPASRFHRPTVRGRVRWPRVFHPADSFSHPSWQRGGLEGADASPMCSCRATARVILWHRWNVVTVDLPPVRDD